MSYAGFLHDVVPEASFADGGDRGIEAHDGKGRDARRAMSAVSAQARLWYWQRISAMVLAVCVVVHLVVIVYASRNGLTAAQILGRTRGSVPFAAFYVIFVLACAVHVPIGLKAIAVEWLRWRGRSVSVAAMIVFIAILVTGLRAVYAVVV